MAVTRPGWRVRAYAPRSVDATERTVLTPIGGAAHSDPFAYTTAPLTMRANILDNPQLDTVLDGWGPVGYGDAVTRETAPAVGLPTGFTAVAKCVTSTSTAGTEGFIIRTSAPARAPCVAGTSYVFSLWAQMGALVGGQFNLYMRWYNSGGSIVQTDNDQPDALNAWSRYSMVRVAPATAVTCELMVREISTSATVYTFYATGAQFEAATQVGDYNATQVGYLGYLKAPRGRRQTLDFLSRKLKGGSMTFSFLDPRTTPGGANASRHLSAFMGDAKGAPRLLGLRFECDFSADVAATPVVWERWYTGRIDGGDTDGGTGLSFPVVDAGRELDTKIFQGLPHAAVTYASGAQLWPLGRKVAYGPYPANPVVLAGDMFDHSGSGASAVGRFRFLGAPLSSPYNVYTAAIAALGVPTPAFLELTSLRFVDTASVMIKHTSGALSGQTHAYDLGGIQNDWFGKTRAPFPLFILGIRAKPGGAAIPADGVTGEVWITVPRVAVTKEAPLYLSDQHPAQFIADALDGYFSPLESDGSVKRSFPRDATSFAAILADTSFQTLRFKREKPVALNKFIEEVCVQSGLGYYLNARGEVALVDLRTPSSLAGVASLAETDLVAGEIPAWSLSRPDAVTRFEVKYYAEFAVTPTDAVAAGQSTGNAVKIDPALLLAADRTLLAIDFGRLDLGDKDYSLDATGIRVGDNEVENGLPREITVQSRLLKIIEDFRNPYGYGPMQTTLRCRRTTVPLEAVVGDLLLVTADKLPNPGTNLRGGERLVRVTEKNDEGGTIALGILDLGPNIVLSAPTIGTIAQETGNTAGGVTFPVTLNGAGDPAHVEVATTDTTVTVVGNVPEVRWSRVYHLEASQTLTIRPLPSSSRVWVRARSVSSRLAGGAIPSSWAYSTGTDYVDLAGLTAPSSLAVGSVTEGSALLTFTNADTVFAVELLLESPSGDGLVPARRYPAGTTQIQLTGLTASATYGAAVRLVDGAGGVSSNSNTVTWTATGAMPVAPVPPVFEITGGAY